MVQVVSERRNGHIYSCSARKDMLIIVSNRNGRREGAIFIAPIDSILAGKGESCWVELMPYDRSRQI